jgi:hypothetical protein
MDERRAIKALLRPDGTNLGERPMRTERALLIVVLAFAMSPITGQFHARSTLALNQQIASSEKGQTMKINIKVGGKTLPATLADNATARDFASVLPLKVPMKDLFGREKYAALPRALSEDGPRSNRYQVGDVAYWSPSHDLAIYYRQDGELIPSPGIIPIAKIDGGAESFNVPGSVKVVIELAE